MPSIAVIVPALSEAGNIHQMVEEVHATMSDEVNVVDNGSTDDTAHQAALAGAMVVSEPRRGLAPRGQLPLRILIFWYLLMVTGALYPRN